MNSQSWWSVLAIVINLFALGVGLAYTISRLEFRMQLIEERVAGIERKMLKQDEINIDLLVEAKISEWRLKNLELKK